MKPLSIITRLAAAAVIATASHAAAAPPPAADLRGWEAAPPPRGSAPADGAVAVNTAGQWVYVASREPVKVTVLTVLGQALSEVSLPAGCHRFRLASRGIYILRAGSSTFRITL